MPHPICRGQNQSQGALGTASAATVGLMHPLSRDDSVCSDTSPSQWGGDWGQAGSAWLWEEICSGGSSDLQEIQWPT